MLDAAECAAYRPLAHLILIKQVTELAGQKCPPPPAPGRCMWPLSPQAAVLWHERLYRPLTSPLRAGVLLWLPGTRSFVLPAHQTGAAWGREGALRHLQLWLKNPAVVHCVCTTHKYVYLGPCANPKPALPGIGTAVRRGLVPLHPGGWELRPWQAAGRMILAELCAGNSIGSSCREEGVAGFWKWFVQTPE